MVAVVMRVGRGADGQSGIAAHGGSREDRWAGERGATVWSGSGVVCGAFPGFAASGGRLAKARLLLSERYLVVNDRADDGFGLRLDDLVDFAPVAGSTRAPTVFRVVWRDRGSDRAFVVQPRLSPLRGGHSGRLTALVQSVGWATEAAAEPESLVVPWEAARGLGDENVIWAGRASAPSGPWAEPGPADAWLSTRSLVWALADGPGLCVVPLAAVTDAAPIAIDRREAIPGLTVAYRDAAGTRHDLVFRFDRHAERDRDVRERGALLVGLRSRGVPLGMPVSAAQPWLRLAAEAPETTVPPLAVAPLDGAAVRFGAHPISMEAAKSGPGAATPDAPDTFNDGEPPVHESVGASSHITAVGGEAPRSRRNWDAVGPGQLVATRRCEATMLADVATLDAALRRGEPVPTGRPVEELRPALADLAAASEPAERAGTNRRRARLLALSEAAVRLRALADLATAGYLDATEIDARRRDILAPLTAHVFPSEAG